MGGGGGAAQKTFQAQEDEDGFCCAFTERMPLQLVGGLFDSTYIDTAASIIHSKRATEGVLAEMSTMAAAAIACPEGDAS